MPLPTLKKITKKENEVLYYLTKEFLTPIQVSTRTKTSKSYVYRVIKKLQKKGIINKEYKMVTFDTPTCEPFKKGIRLHNVELHINIIYKDEKYKKKMQESNIVDIDGNTVRLYNDVIEVYLNKSFWGYSTNKATFESNLYINRLLKRLESDLDIIIVKDRSQNIKVVNSHYSEIENEFAQECEKKSHKLRVEGTKDGLVWLVVDNSFNLHELETVNPKESKFDMDRVKTFFNDIRDNEVPTLSELMKVLLCMAEQNKETSAGLNAVVQLIQPKQELPKEQSKLDNYIG